VHCAVLMFVEELKIKHNFCSHIFSILSYKWFCYTPSVSKKNDLV